jgi:carboxypeptidase Taq
MTAYERLTARFGRIATIREAASILNWDTEVIMPPGAGDARADQTAVLSSLSHGMLVEPQVADDLGEAEAAPPEDPWQQANLRLIRHEHTRAVALPGELVEAMARASSLCEQAWRDARKQSDFGAVAPLLAEVFDRAREAAQALSPALGLAPYDALMDDFQPGIRAADVEPMFARYSVFLADVLPQVEAQQAGRPAPHPVRGVFPESAQAGFCRDLAQRMGLDFRQARLDSSAHPFSGGTPTDQRITTRYEETDLSQALYAVIHETGHALYEVGLPAAWRRQPVGHAAGMAAHESQSLIMEMQASRSDAFLSWLGPALLQAFGGDPRIWAPANLASLWRRVSRSLIRVEADEMTYPAHVALRFTLERELLTGGLKVADLPGAWNGLMQERLGIVPPDDARGCLQDIHWYAGLIGYFPSYTLGAMAAAQLMAAARRDVAGLDEALGQGDFAPLLGWLRTRVHAMGARLRFNELLTHATGKPLDSADFEAHLRRRYLQAGA